MRSHAILAAFLLLLVMFPFPTRAPSMKDWTVLVYLDADNSLEDVGVEDFLEMSSVGSTNEVNIVVQMDRIPGGVSTFGDWTDTRRFYITQGLTPDPQNAIVNLTEVNMADPAQLEAFVSWGMGRYPAKYYFLVLWDHGLGWQGVVVDDSSPPNQDILNATNLHTAFEGIVANNNRRIDLLGNDACRMTLEIQYELADFVDYFVGSEKDEPAAGWPYDDFLRALTANPTMSPGDAASALVDKYVASYVDNSLYSVALSVVSAAGLRAFLGDFNAFLGELAVEEPFFKEEVVAARTATEYYEGGDEYDLYHFVENVLDLVPSRRIERRGEALLAAIRGAVVHERHWDHQNPYNGIPAKNAHGMSLWFPTIGGSSEYARLALSAATLWDEFLSTYPIGVRPQVAANATASAEDADGDGRMDTLALEYAPAVNGTMAVDVYRDGAYVFSREYVATMGRADAVRYPFAWGGNYELSFYLLSGGKLQNLTVVTDIVIHEVITFAGRVTGGEGAPLDGATVTIFNPRTGERATATTNGGEYSIPVVYPTWFRDGEVLALQVRAGDREATVWFNATLPGEPATNRAIVQDVRLDTVGMGAWYAAVGALAMLAAAGLAGTFLYRRKLRKFKQIP